MNILEACNEIMKDTSKIFVAKDKATKHTLRYDGDQIKHEVGNYSSEEPDSLIINYHMMKYDFKEKVGLSQDAINVLKLLPKEYNWIAVDNDGTTWVYENKPIKDIDEYSYYADDGLEDGINALGYLFELINGECHKIEDLIGGM